MAKTIQLKDSDGNNLYSQIGTIPLTSLDQLKTGEAGNGQTIPFVVTNSSGIALGTKGIKLPLYTRGIFINYGGNDGALIAISSNGDIISAFRSNNIWSTARLYQVSGYDGTSIVIGGDFTSIGTWIKNNYIATKWVTAKISPTSSGYFGTASFSIWANMSSTQYGYGWLISDNTNLIVYFRCSGGVFHWYHPTLTEVTG